eukprot:COSAG02_NODE_54650_length_295_cov_0.520408_1_plen_61_part_01
MAEIYTDSLLSATELACDCTVITAMCSSTNTHRHGMPPTIEAAVLTVVALLVSDTGYIGML